MCRNFNTDSNTQSFLFDNFVNIFKDFNDLRHDNDLFNDLFKNVWNFDESFFVGNDWNWSLFVSVNDLQDLFDMVDVSDNLFELLHDNCLFNNSFDLSDRFVFVLDFNDFFVFLYNFFKSFDNDWNFDDLFNDLFDVSVDIDQLWKNSFNFNDLWNFNNDFLGPFDFLNLWNSDGSFDNLLDNLLSCDDLLND
jgi:hypothetical protein